VSTWLGPAPTGRAAPARAPGLRILATSREALGIVGEITYPVPSLSLPDVPVVPPPETLAGSEAVRLFVERATAASPILH